MKTQHVWIIGIIIAFVLGGFFFGKGNISNLFLLGAVLICPLMMLFMHGGHGDHHNHTQGKEEEHHHG